MFRKLIFVILLLTPVGLVEADTVDDAEADKLVASSYIKAKVVILNNVLHIYPHAALNDFYLVKEYGRYTYELTLTDQKGIDRKVSYDAKTGALLKNDVSQE